MRQLLFGLLLFFSTSVMAADQYILVAVFPLQRAAAAYNVSKPSDDPHLFDTKDACEAKLKELLPQFGEVFDEEEHIVMHPTAGPAKFDCVVYEGEWTEIFPIHKKDLKSAT